MTALTLVGLPFAIWLAVNVIREEKLHRAKVRNRKELGHE